MKIKSTFMAMLIACGVLSFNACDDTGDKDKMEQLLPLSLLCGSGSYAIGDTGPSGIGIVFYVTDCGKHGLEVAPVDQSTGAVWSTITNAYANGSSALPAGIGTGMANTYAIVSQNSGAASAARLCMVYHGGGMTDWFLPSKNELAQLYEHNVSAGIFAEGGGYWSSSEFASNAAWGQGFSGGSQNGKEKSISAYVRAIRAF